MSAWNFDMTTAPKKDAPPFESRGPLLILGGLDWSSTGWWNGEAWVVEYDGGPEGTGFIYPDSEPYAWQPFPEPPPMPVDHKGGER